MALIIPTPPAESLNALQSAVADYPEVRALVGANFTAIGPAGSDNLLPHKVFTVGLSDLVSGNWVAAAQLVGWRYLMQRQGVPGVSAEVAVSSSGEHRFAQLNEGPFVDQTAHLIAEVDGREPMKGGSYELAVLRIPALYVMALWMRGNGQSEDVIIPMEPTLETLEPGHQYTIAELSPILAAAASERLGFDDTPQA